MVQYVTWSNLSCQQNLFFSLSDLKTVAGSSNKVDHLELGQEGLVSGASTAGQREGRMV